VELKPIPNNKYSDRIQPPITKLYGRRNTENGNRAIWCNYK